MGSTYNLKRSLAGAAALSLILNTPCWTALAQSSGGAASEALTIAAGPLGDVLSEISLRTGTPIIFAEDLVAGRQAPSVSGAYTAAEAARLALAGSGLEVRASQSGALRVVRVAAHSRPVAEPPVKRPEPETAEPLRAEAELRIDQVSVTGTSLRGIAPESSPLQIYSREDILGSGVTTTEQFIRTLPQSFGGGSSEFAPSGIPGDNSSTYNNTFGSGANLRGLGSGATLTLLNGRRIAPTSRIGDFVDLSMIPISALERVDVLTDGASSIYGGDAVAGVVNFVLRDDYEGAETSARVGGVTHGNMNEVRLSQTMGRGWDSGNLLAVYEYGFRDNLTLADRPEIPVPLLNNGQPIPDAGLFDLMPKQMRHSALLSGRQEITPSLRVSGTGLYSEKSVRSITVLASNTSSVLSFDARSELLSLGGAAEYDISPQWTLTLDGNLSQMRNRDDTVTLAPPLGDESGRLTRSDLWSAGVLVSGSAFSLPGGPVNLALGAQVRSETFSNESLAGALDRDGSRDVGAVYGEMLLPLIGDGNGRPGLRRLELNLSGRLDDYSDFGTTTNPKVGLLWSPASGLDLRGTYSTSFAPPPLGRTGDLGRSAVIAPFSFIRMLLGGVPLSDPALANVDYLQAGGTAADLDPETSRTLTFGADHSGQTGAHGWNINTTYYDTDFEGRLGATPMPQNQVPAFAPFIALENPGALPPGTVVFSPAQAEVDALIASLSQSPAFIGGATGTSNIGVINNASIVRNLSRTQTRGIDVDLGYSFETDRGQFNAGLNVNRILDFDQQATFATPAVPVVNTLLNPAELRLRGRLGYARDGLSGSLFVNHTGSYDTDRTPAAVPIDSWTTFDVALSWTAAPEERGFLKGTRISLSVQNLLDEGPPVTPPIGTARIAGYDPANASPLMRYIALDISKSF